MSVINLRVPDDVLGRIDEVARDRGMTRTAVLLEPWVGRVIDTGAELGNPASRPVRARKVATMLGMKPAAEMVEADEGYKVQVGPVERAPGSLLKRGK